MRYDEPFLIPIPESSSPAFRVFKYGSIGPLTRKQQEAVQPIVDFIMNHDPADEPPTPFVPAELTTIDSS